MSASLKEPPVTSGPTTPQAPAEATASQPSAALATELNRIETTERAVQDRRQQEELARQRELARFD
jgi:hypothetical protein